MPLQSQLATIDFTGGIDTKTHPFLVIPGKLKTLVNGHFSDHNTISKKPGAAALSNTVNGVGTMDMLGGTFALDMLKDELLAFAGGGLYSYSGNQSKWYVRGGSSDAIAATLTKKSILRDAVSMDGIDAATTGSTTLYAWREARASGATAILCSLVDENTGVAYISGTDIGVTTPVGLRCVACNGKLFLFYTTLAGALKVLIFTGAATSIPAAVTVASDVSGATTFGINVDAVGDATDIVVAYTIAGPNVKVARVSAAGALTSSVTFAGTGTTKLAVGLDSSRNIFVAFYDGANLAFRVYSAALASVLGATTITASVAQFRPTFANNGTTVKVYAGSDVRGGSGGIGVATLTSAGVSVAFNALTQHGGIAGRAVYSNSQSRFFIPTVLDDGGTNVPSQTLLALLDGSTGDVVARALVNGANDSAYASVTAAWNASSGAVSIPAAERGRFAAAQNFGSTTLADNTACGLSRLDVSFVDASKLQRASIGDGLVVAGAIPRFYDGVSLTELGYTMFPISVTATPGGVGSLSTGQYQWCAVFEWQDAYGHRHISAPSTPATAAVTSGQACSVAFSTSTLTRKTGARALMIHVYRTEANGTIFYKVSTNAGYATSNQPTPNDTGVALSNMTDSMSDATLIQNEVLYTSGGSVEAAPPPACQVVHFHKRRIFMAGLENPLEVRFTPQISGLDAPLFNENFSLFVPPVDAGGVTALATLDDKLVMFTRNRIYVSNGDGPDATGGGSSFSEPQDIMADVGCVDWRAMASNPDGIMFRSTQGIYLLTRSLSLEYVGAEVEEFNGYVFTKAITLEDKKQVRFLCSQDGDDVSSGVALVWDYLFKQWSVYGGDIAPFGGPYSGVDATLWNGAYTRILGDGSAILRDDDTIWTDNGSPYGLYLETAPIKLAGVQGFQRVRRALIVGDYQSDCTINWHAAYDYDDTYNVADQSSINGLGVYTVGSVFQVRRHLRKQKCEAVRFKLFDSAQASPYRGISLTNLTLEVALKQGAYRGLPAAKSIG